MVRIKVPATSANVGVGFDTLGLAVTFYGECEVELSDKLEITGCPVAFQTEDNLIYQSYKYVLDDLKRPVTPIKLQIDSDIPFARGLGSSAVCIVSGVLAANELHQLHLSQDELVKYCTQIEGHPDNVVPALLGGLSASYQMNDDIFFQHYPVDESYQFVAFVPDFTLETSVARGALPESYPLKTVVANQAKLLFLLDALKTGDAANLDKFLDDGKDNQGPGAASGVHRGRTQGQEPHPAQRRNRLRIRHLHAQGRGRRDALECPRIREGGGI